MPLLLPGPKVPGKALALALLPPRLEVVVTTSDEVLSLRSRVDELQRVLDGLRADYHRLELRYRSEVIINSELQDLCREHGIRFREAIQRFSADGFSP